MVRKLLLQQGLIAIIPLLILGLLVGGIFLAVKQARRQQSVVSRAQSVPAAAAQQGSKINWLGSNWNVTGVNMPWYNWSADFGGGASGGGVQQTKSQIAVRLQQLKDANIHFVRWWVFPGDPWQITRDGSNMPTGLNNAIYADFDAALQLAEQYDLYYNFVLFSAANISPTSWFTNSTQRAKLAQVLTPLFIRYANNPRVMSWEVFNEPEWQIWNGLADEAATVATTKAIADAVHANSPTLVTLGSAHIGGIPMFKDANLDYFSPHWYDGMQNPNDDCARCVTYQQLQTRYGITKPIVIGEMYGGDSQALQKFNDFYTKGYAGAWAWSLFFDHTGDRLQVDLNALKTFTGQHNDVGPRGGIVASSSPSPTARPSPSPSPSPSLSPSPTATPCVKVGDFNGDCVVNIVDLSIMLGFYRAGDLKADLNNDGKLSIGDFSVFASGFGK